MNIDANVNETSNIMMPLSLNQTHADNDLNQTNNHSDTSMQRLKD